jgi:hypothetical protein
MKKVKTAILTAGILSAQIKVKGFPPSLKLAFTDARTIKPFIEPFSKLRFLTMSFILTEVNDDLALYDYNGFEISE